MSHLGSTWSSRVCGEGLVLVESYTCPWGCVAEAWCWLSHTCARGWPPVSVSWDGVKKVEDIFTHNLSYGVNGSVIP